MISFTGKKIVECKISFVRPDDIINQYTYGSNTDKNGECPLNECEYGLLNKDGKILYSSKGRSLLVISKISDTLISINHDKKIRIVSTNTWRNVADIIADKIFKVDSSGNYIGVKNNKLGVLSINGSVLTNFAFLSIDEITSKFYKVGNADSNKKLRFSLFNKNGNPLTDFIYDPNKSIWWQLYDSHFE